MFFSIKCVYSIFVRTQISYWLCICYNVFIISQSINTTIKWLVYDLWWCKLEFLAFELDPLAILGGSPQKSSRGLEAYTSRVRPVTSHGIYNSTSQIFCTPPLYGSKHMSYVISSLYIHLGGWDWLGSTTINNWHCSDQPQEWLKEKGLLAERRLQDRVRTIEAIEPGQRRDGSCKIWK